MESVHTTPPSAALESAIEQDLANYIVRQSYSLAADLPARTRRWLQRKHGVKLSAEEIEVLIRHYQQMYSVIKELLPRHINPSATGFAEPQFIRQAQLRSAAARKFKHDDPDVVEIVIGWVVYYEYLR